jgi:hypothetical protein
VTARGDELGTARQAFAVLGGAERDAMRAEAAAVARGAGESDLVALSAEALGAAGCQEHLDALHLLSWRAGELRRSLELIDLGGPRGTEDAMMVPVVVTAAALAELAQALYVIRNPDSENAARDGAVEAWREAFTQLARLTGHEPVALGSRPEGAAPRPTA